MSKQVITIGYLKEFVSGILDVSIAYDNNAYCPTYKELTDGSICKYYVSDSNPTKTTNGIRIPTCTIDSNENDTYSSNQLVIRQDLELLYQELQSVTVTPDKTSGVSCCGESVGLTTTAYFKLVTKKEGGTTTAETSTNATVTATYSEDKDYTSIASGKLKFEKNSIAYQRGVTESVAARSSKVTASYTYSGVTKTDDETVTQNGNSAKAWSHISDTTTSIAISPTSMSFGSCESSQTYSVTRYYDSYYERYDQCGALLDTRTDKNNGVVTPSKAEKTGSFTVTTSKVSVATNTGAYRTGTLTVTYDGKTDSINLAQAASQAGTYYGSAYGHQHDLDVSIVGSDELSCDGGTASFKAYYYSNYKKDYNVKNDCGDIIDNGTEEYPSTTDVTNSSSWETNVGSITDKGVLTYDSTTSDRTIEVWATYSNLETHAFAYQKDCTPPPPPPPSTCMNVKYTVESGINCTVFFKTTNGTQQAQHSVSKTGDKELCNIAEGTEIVVSCSDTGVTLTGDVSFTYQKGSDIYIGLNKVGGDTGSTDPECYSITVVGSMKNNTLDYTFNTYLTIDGDLKITLNNGSSSETVTIYCPAGSVGNKYYWNGGKISDYTYISDVKFYPAANASMDFLCPNGWSGRIDNDMPAVTGIYIRNNQNGPATIYIPGKNSQTLDMGRNQTYPISVTGNCTIDIEYASGKWCSGSSCYVHVEISGANLEAVDKWGNNCTVRDDADGYTISPDISGSCSASISTRSGIYTVMINIKYIG